MSAKANGFETSLLQLVFNNLPIANIGNAGGLLPASTSGSLFISLHTADPGEAGDQTTSETSYVGYARQGVVRHSSGWTVATNTVQNAATVTYPACTTGTPTITHFGVGTLVSGVGNLLYKGNLGLTVQGPFTGSTGTSVITIPGHTLNVDDRVAFYPAYGSTLPVGIVEGTLYWVKTSALDIITVSTTQGGALNSITATGDGVAYGAATLAVSPGITPNFAAAALVISED